MINEMESYWRSLRSRRSGSQIESVCLLMRLVVPRVTLKASIVESRRQIVAAVTILWPLAGQERVRSAAARIAAQRSIQIL